MKHCLTCGGIVPQGHGHKADQKYCCQVCYQFRNCPPKEELLQELNRTHNLTVTAQLFGADRQSLYKWLKHYRIKKKLMYVG